jgi:hypothetical protein
MPQLATARPSRPGAHGFHHGFPTRETSERAHDDADFERAVTAYRFWYPTVSAEAIFEGLRNAGIKDNQALMIQETHPHHVLFTANSDTPYGCCTLDLRDGPFVIEIPPGPLIGLVDDHHQGWILDMGMPGPAGDRGGKHLVVPPGYNGQTPAGSFAGESTTYKVMAAIRSLPIGGDVKGAMDRLRAVKVFPLSTASRPKPLKVIDISARPLEGSCLRWEDNLEFWRKLHEVIDDEPLAPHFLPMYGQLAALGIGKGKPFAPDPRMRRILERAAKAGRNELLVSAFDSDRADRRAWSDRKWEWVGLTPGSAQFETSSGMDLEARDRWFAQAIVTSPAMFRRTQGAGSLYWLGCRDARDDYLDGGKSYRLSVELPVPGALFWSVTVYDAATRSEIQTPQERAALRSLFELKDTGGSKAIDLFFGPTAPSGQEERWIRTSPGKGWFSYFRIYGPQPPAFDGSWKPGDFEPLGAMH